MNERIKDLFEEAGLVDGSIQVTCKGIPYSDLRYSQSRTVMVGSKGYSATACPIVGTDN